MALYSRSILGLSSWFLLMACDAPSPPCPDVEAAPAEPTKPAECPACPEAKPQAPAQASEKAPLVPMLVGMPNCYPLEIEGTRIDGAAGLLRAVDVFRDHASRNADAPVTRRDALVLLVEHLRHIADRYPFGAVYVDLSVVDGGFVEPDVKTRHDRWTMLGYRIGYRPDESDQFNAAYEADLARLPEMLSPKVTLSPGEKAWLDVAIAQTVADDEIHMQGSKDGMVAEWTGGRAPLIDAVVAAETLAALADPVWADEAKRLQCETQTALLGLCSVDKEGSKAANSVCGPDEAERAALEAYVAKHPKHASATVVSSFLDRAAKKKDTLSPKQRKAIVADLVGTCPDIAEPDQETDEICR